MAGNLNTGPVNTGGGKFHVGDNHTYYIEGLELLLQAYKVQLNLIKSLIDEFKPKTALKHLSLLEEGISDQIKNPEIASKLLFLRATCKRELDQYSIDETAKEFVRAYKLCPDDKELKERAGIEYLNLKEYPKAKAIAEEILQTDEYNNLAWLIYLHISQNFDKTIQEVPSVVMTNYVFRLNLKNYILRKKALGEYNSDFNLEFEFEFEKYDVVTFSNRQLWSITIDLLINDIFLDYPIRFLAGRENPVVNHPMVKELLKLIAIYVDCLDSTELSSSIWHHKHFYYYFNFFLKKDKSYLKGIKDLYPSIPKYNWFYVLTYIQALNINEEFEIALLALNDYENTREVETEFYLVKGAILFFMNKIETIVEIFIEYLDRLKVIDERNGFNILNSFFNVFHNKNKTVTLSDSIEKVKDKRFVSQNLKRIFLLSCEVRYFNIEDERKSVVLSELEELEKVSDLDNNYRSLIAECYQSLGEIGKAVQFLSSFINKEEVSQEVVMYASLLYRKLLSNDKAGSNDYSELIRILRNLRVNYGFIDEELLRIEHTLYSSTNNWDELKKVGEVLKEAFPANEQYLVSYVHTLERLGEFDAIADQVKLFPKTFTNDTIALNLAIILLRNNIEVDLGFSLLFKLASDKSNTQARKEYFGLSIKFNNKFFEKYDTVDIGVWVRYLVNGKDKNEVYIKDEDGLRGKFLGKSVGDKFTDVNSIDRLVHTVEILEIYNDALQLLRGIQEEMSNPLNQLGFRMLEFPKEKEDLEEFFIKNFGAQGSEEKEYSDKALQDYFNSRIGFTEVSRMVFRDKFVDAYFYLTGNSTMKFTTLPLLACNPIDTKQESKYGLDITSTILFYQLSKKFDYNFDHQFVISYYTKEIFIVGLKESENSPDKGFSTEITLEGVRAFPMPNKESKISFYKEILKWIDENCIIDAVEEKLELTLRLQQEGRDNSLGLNYFIDNMFLASRNSFRLITSDLSLYLLKGDENMQINRWLLSPEGFLKTNYSSFCNTELYSFLLKNNYTGIEISLDILKNEFYEMLVGKENYYPMALYNLQFSLHNNPKIIFACTKFLKEVYLTNSITTEDKNRYALDIIRNSMYGMDVETIRLYGKALFTEFKLMGQSLTEVLTVFKTILNIFRK